MLGKKPPREFRALSDRAFDCEVIFLCCTSMHHISSCMCNSCEWREKCHSSLLLVTRHNLTTLSHSSIKIQPEPEEKSIIWGPPASFQSWVMKLPPHTTSPKSLVRVWKEVESNLAKEKCTTRWLYVSTQSRLSHLLFMAPLNRRGTGPTHHWRRSWFGGCIIAIRNFTRWLGITGRYKRGIWSSCSLLTRGYAFNGAADFEF